ncbi:P-loop containing nucleoside triphosphate hydrolase protein [Phaeosphaeria sp. MPI-PUGE-AT-0046c]|nr:P-loop containing nucleoside triphosphate hydrolase protein [Phaeosphaeria sp. MPI-PUGE-AT-0046c]
MVGSTRSGTRTTGIGMNPPGVAQRDRSERDGISRLSEDFEPLHISNGSATASQQRREIDALGLHVKEAISAIGQLEGLGLSKLKIPLPKIIVLGEQSTGKSSVIESISGIKTPRATGTCTRCPLFIKLESAPAPQKWTAQVTLRRSYEFDGKRGRSRQYPGWNRLPEQQILDFWSTESEAELELIISRAQLATVSPLVLDHLEFTKQDISHLDNSHRCSFSPNIVCIHISCVGLPALSFYDLPGIIGQADNLDDVNFVQDLVTEYVKDPESLILVTCSMENDIANSRAGGLSRKLKATDRCIGILTKPDRCHEIRCGEVLSDIFEDKRFAFGHGYFVVRNSDQEQLTQGLTNDEARSQEQLFFEKEMFASKFSKFNHRFGTSNLQAFLSFKLAEQITKRLPVIENEMEARLLTIDDELKHYPEPPSHNAVRIIFDTVLGFTEHVRLQLEGNNPHNGWRIKWTELQEMFFDALSSLKPTMLTSGALDKGSYEASLGSASLTIPVDDDGDAKEDVRMSEVPDTPSKKRKLDDTPVASPSRSNGARTDEQNDKNSDSDFSQHKIRFQLDNVADHMKKRSNNRIPGRIEPSVIEALYLEPLQRWDLPVNAFFKKLEERFKEHIKELFDEHFDKWKGTALYSRAWEIVEEMVNLNLHEQRGTMARESLNDESIVYVFHQEAFNCDKEVILKTYQDARFECRMRLYVRERREIKAKPLSPAELAKLLKDPNLKALFREEPYPTELEAVADVVTYYMIAARRFHDALCMRIQSKFFKQLRTQLRDEMELGLGIHDEHRGRQNAIELLTEDSEREKRRQSLVAQRLSLTQGQKILRDLKQKKYGDDEVSHSSEGTVDDGTVDDTFGLSTPQSETMDEV